MVKRKERKGKERKVDGKKQIKKYSKVKEKAKKMENVKWKTGVK